MNIPPRYPLPLVDGNTLLIDNTGLESFTTCPRQAFYSFVRKIRTSADRTPLTFGGIIHKILEVRYRANTTLHAQTVDVTTAMLAVAEREFANWTPPDEDYRNYSCAVEFIRRYQDEYPFEGFEVLRTIDGSQMVELPFAVPLGEITTEYWDSTKQSWVNGPIKIVWMGRIDLCYSSSNGGGIYVMDHKTTSMMGPSFSTQFHISHQMYGYAWAVEQLLGRQVSAVVVNGLGIRKPTKTGKAFEFQRPVIQIIRSTLDEWRQDTLHIMSDFLENHRRDYFPKHTAWCVGKFGTCAFHKVCTLDGNDQREVMLQSGEFQTNTWSPLD